MAEAAAAITTDSMAPGTEVLGAGRGIIAAPVSVVATEVTAGVQSGVVGTTGDGIALEEEEAVVVTVKRPRPSPPAATMTYQAFPRRPRGETPCFNCQPPPRPG